MVRYQNRYGRQRSYYTSFEGAIPYIQRHHDEAESDSSRERYAGYMREVPCPVCQGSRLKPESLAVTVDGRSIALPACALPIGELAKLLLGIELSERDMQIAARVLKEVNARLGFLLDVGLDYLTLDRAAATLAGGEAQRIRLATQIGSGLVGVLYVLDEPSIGLHQRDNHRLLETLLRLRDLGNTLIVVEHDEDIDPVCADWVVDIGPGAEHGGEIVVAGPVRRAGGQPEVGHRRLPVRAALDPGAAPAAQARPRPRGRGEGRGRAQPAAGWTWRSRWAAWPAGGRRRRGQGKSTLVNEILYNALGQGVAQAKGRCRAKHVRVTVMHGPAGQGGACRPGADRPNPAVQPGHLYRQVFDHIRRLFAQTTEAKIRGYQPGRFSSQRQGRRTVRGLLRR